MGDTGPSFPFPSLVVLLGGRCSLILRKTQDGRKLSHEPSVRYGRRQDLAFLDLTRLFCFLFLKTTPLPSSFIYEWKLDCLFLFFSLFFSLLQSWQQLYLYWRNSTAALKRNQRHPGCSAIWSSLIFQREKERGGREKSQSQPHRGSIKLHLTWCWDKAISGVQGKSEEDPAEQPEVNEIVRSATFLLCWVSFPVYLLIATLRAISHFFSEELLES